MQRHPYLLPTPCDYVHKSLGEWVCNIADGGPYLDSGYSPPSDVVIHPWDEEKFLSELEKAERQEKLSPGGNRAVLFCSTTDPYQVLHHPDSEQGILFNSHRRTVMRRALRLIRDHSTLRVRILTRSPLAQEDFNLFKSFGDRLMFGMYLPTLRDDLSRIYERNAPLPDLRWDALHKAKETGLHVFVVMAPTYPDSDEDDLRPTLYAIADFDPLTVFHGVMRLNADDVARVVINAALNGTRVNTKALQSRRKWIKHALHTFGTVERIATCIGLDDRLHLWPDLMLGTDEARSFVNNPSRYRFWLNQCWGRVSEWPQASR